MNLTLTDQLKLLPSSPGVYIYRNSKDEIIYVGKAINLKKRVTQYFQSEDALGAKTNQLVSQIANIETKVVGSEIEALILESNLIKKHRPKYNSQLKDDKSYLYICISKDKFPIISTYHQTTLPENTNIYGPFPDSRSVKSLLKTIRRIFPFYTKANHSKKECLFCHIGVCPGPNPNNDTYKKNIKNIKKILSGDFKKLETNLKKEILLLSKTHKFEEAILVRGQLLSLQYIVSGWKNLNNLFENINLADDKNDSSIRELSTIIKPYFPLIKKISRIECYDISQLGNKYFVGSMTVAIDGKLDNSQYRKFKIESHNNPNDQLMIKEVVYRRLKHSEWNFPDLIVVDGGKPQVTAVSSLITRKDVAFIGLAKRLETIVIKTNDNWVEINLPKNSSALRLLQQIRDEAHRFANKFRKELISKTLVTSLD